MSLNSSNPAHSLPFYPSDNGTVVVPDGYRKVAQVEIGYIMHGDACWEGGLRVTAHRPFQNSERIKRIIIVCVLTFLTLGFIWCSKPMSNSLSKKWSEGTGKMGFEFDYYAATGSKSTPKNVLLRKISLIENARKELSNKSLDAVEIKKIIEQLGETYKLATAILSDQKGIEIAPSVTNLIEHGIEIASSVTNLIPNFSKDQQVVLEKARKDMEPYFANLVFIESQQILRALPENPVERLRPLTKAYQLISNATLLFDGLMRLKFSVYKVKISYHLLKIEDQRIVTRDGILKESIEIIEAFRKYDPSPLFAIFLLRTANLLLKVQPCPAKNQASAIKCFKMATKAFRKSSNETRNLLDLDLLRELTETSGLLEKSGKGLTEICALFAELATQAVSSPSLSPIVAMGFRCRFLFSCYNAILEKPSRENVGNVLAAHQEMLRRIQSVPSAEFKSVQSLVGSALKYAESLKKNLESEDASYPKEQLQAIIDQSTKFLTRSVPDIR